MKRGALWLESIRARWECRAWGTSGAELWDSVRLQNTESQSSVCGYSHVTPGLRVLLIQKNLKVQVRLRGIVRLYLTNLPSPPTKKKIKKKSKEINQNSGRGMIIPALRRWKQGGRGIRISSSSLATE